MNRFLKTSEIPNELYFNKNGNFTEPQKKVLFHIYLKTFGFNKQFQKIPISDFIKYCHISKNTLLKTLQWLEINKFMTVKRGDANCHVINSYGIYEGNCFTLAKFLEFSLEQVKTYTDNNFQEYLKKQEKEIQEKQVNEDTETTYITVIDKLNNEPEQEELKNVFIKKGDKKMTIEDELEKMLGDLASPNDNLQTSTMEDDIAEPGIAKEIETDFDYSKAPESEAELKKLISEQKLFTYEEIQQKEKERDDNFKKLLRGTKVIKTDNENTDKLSSLDRFRAKLEAATLNR